MRRVLTAILGTEPQESDVEQLLRTLRNYTGLVMYLAAYEYEETKKQQRRKRRAQRL